MSRLVFWSAELAHAVNRIANDRSPKPQREELAQDVRSRAYEFTGLRIGHALEQHQVSYVQCFRSRLGDSHAIFDGEAEFETAWSAAYRLSNQENDQ